jgi:hypothetical protein
MGHEPLTKFVVLAVFVLQLTMAFLLRHNNPFSWKFVAAAYVIGGTANHNLFLAIHEITHNLAFKGVKANKMLAILANLPIGVPYSISFKVSYIFAIIIQAWSFHMSGLCRGIIWSTISISDKTGSTLISPRDWNSCA